MAIRTSRPLRTIAAVLLAVSALGLLMAHLDRAQARGDGAPAGPAPASSGPVRLHATHFPDAARTGERPPAPPGPADPVAAPAIGLAYGDELPGMDAAGLASALDDAVTVGGTVRLDVSWADVQHDGPGVWDWSGLDRVLAATRARGLDVIGVVAYTPAWARVAGCDDEKCRPASYADFAAFAGAAAARYGAGGIGAWEIWNEPNNAAFWMPAPDPADYAAMLEPAAAAIRAADPGAVVLAGGLAAVPDAGGSVAAARFLRALCARGAAALVDGVAYHPYTYPLLASDRPEGFSTAWNAMRDGPESLRGVLDDAGATAMPVWITEYGAPTGGPGSASDGTPESIDETTTHVTEARQAEIARDSVAAARADGGVAALVWYSGRDRGTDPADAENFYGLRRADGSPKPALAALREAVSDPAPAPD